MAKEGVGPCGSFCDTGDFCKDGKCGCERISKCAVPYSASYKHHQDSCVRGKNIKPRFKGKTVNECAKLCDDNSKCLAFEFGNGRATKGKRKKGDCVLNRGVKQGGKSYCKKWGLDLYI
jgi:hypothetical protein